MVTKGHPRIYLSAAVFAATCLAALLSGCAENEAVLEKPPLFSVRAHVTFEGWSSDTKPLVVISSIYKKDEPTNVFTPSPTAQGFWLRPGDYIVKIDGCKRPGDDESLRKYGTRLGPNHLFEFSVKANRDYHLDCTTDADGILYAWNIQILVGAID